MTDDSQDQPKISIGGNVTGGNVLIGSKQTIHGDLSIQMGNMPGTSVETRETLKQQITKLLAELEKQPATQTKDVVAVKMAAEDAVAEADKPQPNKERLQIRGDKLMEAAKNLAAVAPIAVQIAKTLLMIA